MIGGGIEGDSEKFQIAADAFADGSGMFADAAGEGNPVTLAERRDVGPDIFTDAIGKELQRQFRLLVSARRRFKVANVRAEAGKRRKVRSRGSG